MAKPSKIDQFTVTPAKYDWTLYLTLFNESAEPQGGCVALESKALGASALLHPQPLLGSPPERTPLGWQTRLDPGRTAVWELVD